MKQKLSSLCSLVGTTELEHPDEELNDLRRPLSRRRFCPRRQPARRALGMTVIVAPPTWRKPSVEYLVAMDAGRLLASDWLKNVMSCMGARSLEQAYVALLPADRRPKAARLRSALREPRRRAGNRGGEADEMLRGLRGRRRRELQDRRGEIFGFLGSNGCGKTTTMKMSRVFTTSPAVRRSCWDTRSIPRHAHSAAHRLHVAGLLSMKSSPCGKTCTCMHGCISSRRVRHTRGRGALRDFDLETCADALPASLPLGIRQRLQLAAACLHEPEVLLLDEPTSGVDPAARDMFWRHLSKLSREKKVTLFVSTHFMNEAALCDRISLMHRGTVSPWTHHLRSWRNAEPTPWRKPSSVTSRRQSLRRRRQSPGARAPGRTDRSIRARSAKWIQDRFARARLGVRAAREHGACP